MVWTDGLVLDEEYWAQWPEVLSVGDLARITRKGTPTIWRWLPEGKIPAHRIAGSWIVYRDVFHQRLVEPDTWDLLPLALLDRFPEELSVAELSDLLGKTRQTVWRWLADGKLPGVGSLYEGNWLIYKHELVQLLKRTTNQSRRDDDSTRT